VAGAARPLLLGSLQGYYGKLCWERCGWASEGWTPEAAQLKRYEHLEQDRAGKYKPKKERKADKITFSVPLFVLSKAPGHRTLTMTARYSHLAPDSHRAAFEAVAKSNISRDSNDESFIK
jgi:hypothetical protein